MIATLVQIKIPDPMSLDLKGPQDWHQYHHDHEHGQRQGTAYLQVV